MITKQIISAAIASFHKIGSMEMTLKEVEIAIIKDFLNDVKVLQTYVAVIQEETENWHEVYKRSDIMNLASGL
jgi:hypothetical protein